MSSRWLKSGKSTVWKPVHTIVRRRESAANKVFWSGSSYQILGPYNHTGTFISLSHALPCNDHSAALSSECLLLADFWCQVRFRTWLLRGYGIENTCVEKADQGPTNTQPDNVLEGMDILLKGALGTGRKTVARAIKARGTPLAVAYSLLRSLIAYCIQLDLEGQCIILYKPTAYLSYNARGCSPSTFHLFVNEVLWKMPRTKDVIDHVLVSTNITGLFHQTGCRVMHMREMALNDVIAPTIGFLDSMLDASCISQPSASRCHFNRVIGREG
ncbi:hypothetical protein EV424DRAFT_1555008 [Suillus variegatus]|nr:hypothetical protein EV424DRAFT_1555008 [Suillus variegatus]